jgi:thiol-disulfide isomerase/thioredoxin
MEHKFKLRYDDLVSPTMNPNDYLEQFKDKIAVNYSTYDPKLKVLEQIKQLLNYKKEKLKIVALGADWCPDCNRNVPRMIKIVNTLNSEDIEFQILYGIKKNAFHKPGEIKWHKTRSPSEATDPKFDLQKLPTFYFFNKDNKLIGKIEENPKKTIEEDLLEILESKD